LSAVPPSIIDEYGWLHKGDRSVLVCKHLGITQQNPSNANVVLIDGCQMLYHIGWPVAGVGKVADVAESIAANHRGAEKFVIFDQYERVSAKEHERQ